MCCGVQDCSASSEGQGMAAVTSGGLFQPFFPSNSTKLPYKSPQLGWDPSVGGLIPGQDAESSAACVSIRVWLLLHVSL